MNPLAKAVYLKLLNQIAPGWVTELEFSPWRKWRFDFAYPPKHIAIEINGEAWKTRGGGRHGKPADLQKLNAATTLYWRVFQYGTSEREMTRMLAEIAYVIGNNDLLETAFSIDHVKRTKR